MGRSKAEDVKLTKEKEKMTQFTDFDRYIKSFEESFDIKLPPRVPLIIRIDGRSFRNYTKKFTKPFDEHIRNAMVYSTLSVMNMVSGSKVGFTQSDETSILVKYYEHEESQPFLGNRIQKLCSIIASCFTARFNELMFSQTSQLAEFDCRVFSMPAANIPDYFVWRQVDCIRNSILCYAQQFFTHKEMQGRKCKELAEVTDWIKGVHDKYKYGTTIYEYVDQTQEKQFLRGFLQFSKNRRFFDMYNLELNQCLNA